MSELGIIAIMCLGFLYILRDQAKGLNRMLENQQRQLAEICSAHGETARQAIEGYNSLRTTLEELREALEAMADQIGSDAMRSRRPQHKG